MKGAGDNIPAAETAGPRRYRDPHTGKWVIELTPDSARSESVYFESCGFADHDQWVIYSSDRDGKAGIYRAQPETGPAEALVIPEALHRASITVGPDDRTLYYHAGNTFWRMDVDQPDPQPVWTVSDPGTGELAGYPVSLTKDGNWAVLATIEPEIPDAPIPFAVIPQNRKPTHLWRIHLPTGEARHLLRFEDGFSHPLIHPLDPDRITFVPNGARCWNMEAPEIERTRTWIIERQTDGTFAARPFLRPFTNRVITHESWSPCGNRLFFFDKHFPDWCPASVCSVDAEGKDWQCHMTSYRHYLGHGSCSPCGRYFVADCQRNGESPLYEIDLQSGGHRILCWPNASQDGGHGAGAHVHASYSRTGRYIVFTSDVSGVPRVYVYPRGQDSC